MTRHTGTFRMGTTLDETVRAFVPHPLPPADPPLAIEGELALDPGGRGRPDPTGGVAPSKTNTLREQNGLMNTD